MPKVLIGRIVASKGYRGDIFLTDIVPGKPHLDIGTIVSIGFSEQFSRQYTISRWEAANKGVILSLEEITSDTQAKELRERGVFVEKELIKYPNQKKHFLPDELDGCEVFDYNTGLLIGKVVEVWILPANDVWLVSTEKGNLPVPVAENVVKNVDIERRRIEIVIIPGLMDIIEG